MKCGSICFWGEFFGRPYDNCHMAESVIQDTNEDLLCIRFNEGELCRIFCPRGIVDQPGVFFVEDASAIEWEWVPYGSKNAEATFVRISYKRREDRLIDVTGGYYFGRKAHTLDPEDHFAFEIC